MTSTTDRLLADLIAELRDAGWSIAIHNDYRLMGERNTFYLLTHDCGRWVKGEGATDEYALSECLRQVKRYSMDNRPPQPYAVSQEEKLGDGRPFGVLSMCFNTYDEAVRYWRWSDLARSFALAEQQAEPGPAIDGGLRSPKMPWQDVPSLQGVVAEHFGTHQPSEPPRVDWFMNAMEAAHKTAAKVYNDIVGTNGYGRTERGKNVEASVVAALVAFIAAMPPQHDHGRDAEFEQFQIALTHAYEGVTGEQVQWSNNFGPKDAAESILATVQSPGPQPEEVPEEIFEAAYLTYEDMSWHERADFRAAFAVIWSAARRYAPMPAVVTEEMVESASRIYLRDFSHPTVVTRRMLEAALSASLAKAEGE